MAAIDVANSPKGLFSISCFSFKSQLFHKSPYQFDSGINIPFDNLKNFWAQGDVITLTFERLGMVDGKEEPVGEPVLKLTMKGQNLVNMTNALNGILNKLKEKKTQEEKAKQKKKEYREKEGIPKKHRSKEM